MPHNCPMWSPTWGNSAQTSDSGSCGPTPLASAVGCHRWRQVAAGLSSTTQVYGVSPVLPHGIWPWRLSCLRPLERGYVSGVPLDLAGPRAQMRAHRRPGVRSSPWSGTLWATPGSSGRQGSAVRGVPMQGSACTDEEMTRSRLPSPTEGRGAGRTCAPATWPVVPFSGGWL